MYTWLSVVGCMSDSVRWLSAPVLFIIFWWNLNNVEIKCSQQNVKKQNIRTKFQKTYFISKLTQDICYFTFYMFPTDESLASLFSCFRALRKGCTVLKDDSWTEIIRFKGSFGIINISEYPHFARAFHIFQLHFKPMTSYLNLNPVKKRLKWWELTFGGQILQQRSINKYIYQ